MISSTQDPAALEVEQQRQDALRELNAENEPNWLDQFAPGTFGCHELLDRALLAAELVEQSVLSHPACVQNGEWYALAERAVAALNDLYQQIGAEHLADHDDCENAVVIKLRGAWQLCDAASERTVCHGCFPSTAFATLPPRFR